MQFDITLDFEAEQIVIIVDNATVLHANKGETPGSLILDKNFRKLEGTDEKLFHILRQTAVKLFTLEE